MAVPIDIQLQNAKTSLLFMQQDHAHTLQGLHQEIQKLQKKCAEMTFELAMKGDVNEEAYQEENQRLDKLLREKTIECNNMQDLLDKKEKRISVLELQLRAQEKRYTDEIKQKNLKIYTMKNELDKKTGVIAVLSNELQQVSLRSSQENGDSSCDVAVTPVPPTSTMPTSRRKISIRKPLGHNLGNANRPGPMKAVQLGCYNPVSRNVSPHSGAGYQTPELNKDSQRPGTPTKPEPTNSKVFVVRQKEHSNDVIVRQKLPVLPPIVNQGDSSMMDSSKQPALLHPDISGSGLSKKETLAVSSLFHQDNLRKVEHSNSD
ncbi:coiled-coil domain-containing protein 92-like [Anneissia japonica]|uniref:coiled-coil domain-containing protein 92-like n=1 Tax=Anneissia japonica TaxID=1529436 RepID=UPI001425A6C4|nr:coiled-coil domain-containing protein 92-like [Anneissia japonica]XP_033117008.1 coiled-coil domain-containing protein 92-like [Anneissia japonica]